MEIRVECDADQRAAIGDDQIPNGWLRLRVRRGAVPQHKPNCRAVDSALHLRRNPAIDGARARWK